MWLAVITLYPLASAFLQEIVFRAFFTLRYRALFNHAYSFVIINATIFGWVHILFGNFIAVTFTFLGGVLFARTYLKTRSTLLCAVEHSLYGDFIFTIGLGKFFYHGA